MSNILVIDSAATGEASVSRTLVGEAVAALEGRRARPRSSTATSTPHRCRT